MNTPSRLARKTAALLAALVIISPCVLSARVGESQDVVERRILQPGLGKLYPRTVDVSKDKDARPKKKEDDPVKDVRAFLPPDAREMVYWKSAIASQLSNDTGWKLDVVYVGGRSSLEIYRRVGDSLSEFEIRGILNVNKGASSWKKNSSDGGGVKGIGYDYELEDGSARAKTQGNWIIVFATKLDTFVMQQQVAAKAAGDLQKEEQKREQALRAPESIMGF